MTGYSSTIAAIGFDMDGNEIWNTAMSSSVYPRIAAENSSGFHLGQNVVTWINRSTGGVYGQNISPNGVITSIEEQAKDPMVTIKRIYTMNGQCLKHNNPDELCNGIYIIQGLTKDGKLVTRKIVVNH